MLNIPENIRELFLENNTHKKFKLTFYEENSDSLYPSEILFPEESLYPAEHGKPWLIIENDRIVSESLKISQSLCSKEELVFGAGGSAELQITVTDLVEDIIGREFTITLSIHEYEMSLGKYTVQSVKRETNKRKKRIIAYDRMKWFNVDVSGWYQELSFPMTLKAFRSSLCQYIGIEQKPVNLLFDTMQLQKNIDPGFISGTEILRSICEINGCFAIVDYDGKLKYIHLAQTGLYPSETLYPDEELYPGELGGNGEPVESIFSYRQPIIYEDYLVEGITGISIFAEDGSLGASVGQPFNEYIIQGNFLIYGKTPMEMLDMANSLLPVIERKLYRPAKVDCQFRPWLELGDAIQIFTHDDIIETYILNRIISGCQAMQDNISSSGNKLRENKNTLHDKLIESEHKMVVADMTAEKVYVVLEDFKQDTLAKLETTSNTITAEVKRATEKETEISSKIVLNAEKLELKVNKGNVSEIISQESDNISLVGNRLSWQSDKSSLIADGTLSCDGINVKNGSFNGTVTGSKIIGSTITGATITGTIISGAEIKSPKISGGTLTDVDLKSVDLKSTESFHAKYVLPGAISCGDAVTQDADFTIISYKYYFGKSDKRLKTNIIPLKSETGMAVTSALNPVSFSWMRFGNPGIGFIAQETKKVADNYDLSEYCYCQNCDGYYSVPYQNYVGVMAAAIKNLKKTINALKEKKHEGINL